MKTRNIMIIITAMALSLAVGTAQAQTTYTRQNNTTLLNVAGAWNAGGPPTGVDIAKWDSTCGANVGTALGGNVTWGQILLTNNVGSAVTIANTASSTLTLNGVSGTGIDMSAANQNLTINNPVTLGAAQTWNVGSGRTLAIGNPHTLSTTASAYTLTVGGAGLTSINGPMTGSGGIIMNGSGRLWLATGTVPTHTYSGETILSNGVTMIAGNLSVNSLLTMNGGVLEDYWTSTFTRALGAGANQVRIIGGASGFGNNNGSNSVRISTNANYEVVWGAANEAGNANATGFFNPSTFVLQTQYSQGVNTLTFENKIDLNGTTRTIQANSGLAGTSIATISGAIRTSSGTAGLIKTGAGTLLLSNAANAWNGDTVISQGWMDLAGMSNANLGGGVATNITVAAGSGIRFNTLSNTFLSRLVPTNAEITVMTGTTANNLDFSSTGANLPNAFLGNWAGNGAKMEYSGTLTPASDNYRLGAKYSNGLLGIVGANKLTGTQGLIVGGTGASGIRVELAAAQNFSGDTVINTGARLSLGNNLALQNSTLDVGAAGGNFSLAAGTNGGRITGETAAPSPTFGGLKGSRNLLTVFSAAGGNNETLLVATAITGFTLNVGTGKTLTYSGAIGGFGTGGASTLTKTGDGTQILSGNNTYSGATTISAGTLQLGDGGASGALGSGAVQNDATLVFNRSDIFTVANLMAGSGQLEKAGSGTMILTAANTYSGSTTISGGNLIGMVGGGCENSDLTINNTAGCTVGVAINDNTKQWTCKSLTAAGTSSALVFSFTTGPSLTLAPLNVTGDLTFTGIPSITVDPSYLVSGQSYPLIVVAGTAPSGEPPVTIGNGLTGTATWTGNTLWLNVGGTSTSALPLVWKTSTAGTWDTSTLNWNDSTLPTPNTVAYSEGLLVGDSVVFDDTVSANTVITLSTTVKPSSVTVDNSVRDYTISGAGSISGITGLTKSGSKALTLSTPNAFIGPLDLTGGTLKLGNASALGAGKLTIAGGTTLDSTVANLVLTGSNPHDWTGNFTFTGSQSLTLGSGAVTLSGNPQVTVSANTLTVVGPISGSGISLSKAGNGTLVLSGANTYTGGTTLNGGTVTAGANANLGADGSTITFAGNATLATVHSAYPVFAKGVAVNSGVTASLNPGSQFYKMTFTGPLSGNGTLDFNTGSGGAGSDLTFSSDANTFTGKVQITMSGNAGGGLTVNSLADGANPVQLKGNANPSIFKLGAGTASPLLFNSRWIELNGTLAGGGTIQNNNATVENTITINTDLLVSATGNKTLTLGGSNTGNNTFAGKIVDGTGAVISLLKADNGTWILSGANTFTGPTTVSAGKLVLAAGTCLSDTAALSIAAGKVVQIETGVKEKVGSLKLNNVTQAAGIYGSTTSAAPPANQSAYFTGTGLLYVGVDLPPLGTFIRIN